MWIKINYPLLKQVFFIHYFYYWFNTLEGDFLIVCICSDPVEMKVEVRGGRKFSATDLERLGVVVTLCGY